MITSSPPYPSSFDPAIHLHSEAPEAINHQIPSEAHDDQLEALAAQLRESTAAKNKAGIVIQHRAWKLPEVFRSEEEYPIST